MFSKLEKVSEIYVLDLSEYSLTKVAPLTFKYLQARTDKINLVVGDFYNLSYFANGFFDCVAGDAVLHHSDNSSLVLCGVARVLNKNGFYLGLQEPVLPAFRPYLKFIFGKKRKRIWRYRKYLYEEYLARIL